MRAWGWKIVGTEVDDEGHISVTVRPTRLKVAWMVLRIFPRALIREIRDGK